MPKPPLLARETLSPFQKKILPTCMQFGNIFSKKKKGKGLKMSSLQIFFEGLYLKGIKNASFKG